MIEQFPSLQDLSPREKLILANELADQFQVADTDEESKSAIMEMFQKRWEHFQENPDSAMSWEDFKEKLGFAK